MLKPRLWLLLTPFHLRMLISLCFLANFNLLSLTMCSVRIFSHFRPFSLRVIVSVGHSLNAQSTTSGFGVYSFLIRVLTTSKISLTGLNISCTKGLFSTVFCMPAVTEDVIKSVILLLTN